MFNIQTLIEQKSQEGLPAVMGVLNVTPDSFSDGGRFLTPNSIEKHVLKMIEGGADVLDIGGESTRPGALAVSLSEELERVIPIIEWVTSRFDVPVSIDTYKTSVMQEAVNRGAHIINDVNALQAEGAVDVAIKSGVSVCLMHKQGDVSSMQKAPFYNDVLLDVTQFLLAQAKRCETQGLLSEKIVLDPGFGFGKTLLHNETLFQNLDYFTAMKYPIMVGVSRKKMIADILDDASILERVNGSVAAAVLAALKGVKMVRVHDVKETVDALKITMRLM